MSKVFSVRRLLLTCFLACFCWGSVFALRKDSLIAPQDTLIAVDEDQLVSMLIQLVQHQRQTSAKASSELPEWLRIQLLADAFDPKQSQGASAAVQGSLALRLSQLEQVVNQLVLQQTASGQRLSPELQQALQQQSAALQQIAAQQSNNQQLFSEQATVLQRLAEQQRSARRNNSTPIPIPLPVGATRNDSLEYQLKTLRAELQQLRSDSLTVAAMSSLGAVHNGLAQGTLLGGVALSAGISQGVSTHIPAAQSGIWVGADQGAGGNLQRIPADFERSLFFSLSSARIGSDAKEKLSETLQFLAAFPQARIALTGYSSPEGNRQFNDRLAQQRQWAVRNYLLQHGVQADRIVLSSHGVNRSAVGAQVARRVDISLLQ